jgi:hypothetical protein
MLMMLKEGVPKEFVAMLKWYDILYIPKFQDSGLYAANCSFCKIHYSCKTRCAVCPLAKIGQHCFDAKNSVWNCYRLSLLNNRKATPYWARRMFDLLEKICLDAGITWEVSS